MKSESVFVTVGTTEFDQLVKSVTSVDVCKTLRQLGYTKLLLQIGRGEHEPQERELGDHSPAVQYYRFKDSIANDIAAADLVICHAGAGSVLETLAAGKAAVVVINDELMNNHQVELAKRLQQLQHLYYCTCSTLQKTLQEADFSTLQPYTPGNSVLLASHLQSLLQTPSSLSQFRVLFWQVVCVCLLALIYLWTPVGASLLVLALIAIAVVIMCARPKEAK